MFTEDRIIWEKCERQTINDHFLPKQSKILQFAITSIFSLLLRAVTIFSGNCFDNFKLFTEGMKHGSNKLNVCHDFERKPHKLSLFVGWIFFFFKSQAFSCNYRDHMKGLPQR